MKAQSIDTSTIRTPATGWNGSSRAIAAGLLAQARALEIVAMLATRLAAVLVPALTIVLAAALAVSTPGLDIYLQAGLWTGGFLFYALAIEASKSGTATLLLVSGAAIQALTYMSSRLATELAVAAAALVAAWAAVSIARVVFKRRY